jgi:predicted metalloprotease with PDZ domain
MRLDAGVTKADLNEDWTMTHEFVHMALSSLPDESHWLEEGLATYVEPIARAQAGQLPVEEMWEGVVQGMAHGEPGQGDRGLDQTHTWGRTYWGGALFCLVADVKIREATHNQKGLQDALRAIVGSGATIDTEQPVERVLGAGDRATGTTVLVDLYNSWKNHPVSVDLNQLWVQLGVQTGSHGIQMDSSAPLASIRAAITTPREPR